MQSNRAGRRNIIYESKLYIFTITSRGKYKYIYYYIHTSYVYSLCIFRLHKRFIRLHHDFDISSWFLRVRPSEYCNHIDHAINIYLYIVYVLSNKYNSSDDRSVYMRLKCTCVLGEGDNTDISLKLLKLEQLYTMVGTIEYDLSRNTCVNYFIILFH